MNIILKIFIILDMLHGIFEHIYLEKPKIIALSHWLLGKMWWENLCLALVQVKAIIALTFG